MTETKKALQKLDITQKQKVGYAIPLWLRDLNIESNIKAVKERIQPHYEDRAEPIAVVCYGPSLNYTWEEIKKFKYVLSCSGAHKFLIERGIIPNWDCNVDPREHKVTLMGPPHKDVEYLVASTCSPKLVEHLEGYNVKLWHIFDGTADAQRTLPAGEWSLFGGASAGLRALALARFLGFKDLHVFGMDGCESDKYGKHAAAHPNQPKDHQLCEYGGKTYKTTASLAECLPRFSLIETEDGFKPIKALVESKYSGKVKSLDSNGRFVWNNVIGHSCLSNRSAKKQWVSVVASEYDGRSRLKCTSDHLCAVTDNVLSGINVHYVPASQTVGKYLIRGVRCKSPNENPLYNQEQISVVAGTMMGDGTIGPEGRLRTGHCEKQKEYLLLKQSILGGAISKSKSGSGFSAAPFYNLDCPINAQTKEFREIFYPVGGVKSPVGALDYLNDLGLAFWYMDDGYIDTNKNGASYGMFLCTDSFSYSDHEVLCEWFKKRWDLNAVIAKVTNRGRKYSRLRFNTESSNRFCEIINEFVPPSMRYKLPTSATHKDLYQFDTKFLDFSAAKVTRIQALESRTGYYSSKLYDIEVEHDHNFVADNTVVHNCARQTPHEIDQLNDVTATFYGEGLCQAIMKDHKKKPVMKGTPTVGFSKPELISPEYLELNKRLHKDNLLYGVSGSKYVENVLKLVEANKAKSVIDYGAGKCLLAKGLPFPIWCYDPAIPEISESPRPADLVVCTNVLEHIEPEKLNFVLADLQRCVKQIGYFVIDTKAATKTLADGRNTHLIIQGEKWWNQKLSKFFTVGSIQNMKSLLHVIVAPKKAEDKAPQPETTMVGNVKFYTPNAVTKWRANTLLTKEPITIEWINSMKSGEVMYDVGANVGGYTVWAGSRGVTTYAFEPEAENYALLVRNMVLNKIEPNAYCLAISDKTQLGTLNLSQAGVGGSCHTFGEAHVKSPHQGCYGVTLDSLLDSGLPQPDHIKIDVDGLESNVIAGAEKLLSNVKSLLIEINTNSANHMDIVKKLQGIGFVYDAAQVEKSTRKDGAFKGCAEYLFKRVGPTFKNPERIYEESTSVIYGGYSVAPSDNVAYFEKVIVNKILDCKVIEAPTPHIFVEDIFPDEVYQSILDNLPNDYVEISKVRGVKGYKERLVSVSLTPFWKELDSKLRNGVLKEELCNKFGIASDGLSDETLLIRDLTGYKIGPHTDSPAKVISALFYLPKDESQIEAGTSLYVPKKVGFKCKGGPHLKFSDFKKVETLPFKPNSLFAFLKTDTSFHGVEPYQGAEPRDVLLYDIRKSQ